MKKKLLSLIICLGVIVVSGLSLVIGLLPSGAYNNVQQEPNLNASVVSDSATRQEKGGVIYVEEGSTYTMHGGTISGEGTTYGGAVYVSSGATFKMVGGIIEDCTASYGGAIFVASGGTCIIDGGTIDNCNATSGGAIYIESSGKCIFNDGTISNCDATSKGGAAYVSSGGNFDFTNGKITSTLSTNNAEEGGGIYNAGTFNFSNGIITGLKSSGNGGGVYSKGHITITGGSILNCSGRFGGGVHILSNSANLSNVSIKGNSAEQGGGLYVIAVTVNLTNSLISNNTVSTSGGGITLSSQATVNLDDDTVIEKNSSSNYGGGLMVYSSSVLNINGATISSNSAKRGGGAYVGNSASVVMGSGMFSNNTSSDSGGGVGLYAGTLQINGGTLHNNTSNLGGNIYSDSASSINLTNINTSIPTVISGDGITKLATNGGGIESFGSLSIGQNVLVTKCVATEGGGIYLNTSKKTIINGIIKDNSATNGAGIYSLNSPSVEYYCDILQNAASGHGGGVYISGSSQASFFKGIIEDNTAVNGGGICLAGTSRLIDNSIGLCEIKNNIATNYGGGIYSNSTYTNSVTYSLSAGFVITGNKAVLGGGIYSNSTTELLSTIKLSKNTASDFGGGVYCLNQLKTSLIINPEDGNYFEGLISENTARHGAGIYQRSGTLNLETESYISIEKNTSDVGGGIYIYSGTATINTNVVNNTATLSGGACFAYTNATVNVSGGTISNNSSKSGGAFNVYGTINITKSSIFSNEATEKGGGVYCLGTFKMSGGTISKCSANQGGGVYLTNTSNITGGKLYQNSANEGGGIYTESFQTISGMQIEENTASTNGAGIYAKNSLTINMSAVIHKNTATSNGGGIYNETPGSLIEISSAIISSNNAVYGAGVFMSEGVNLSINASGEINSNNSTLNGGGIYSEKNTIITINGGKVNFNRSNGGNGGGGIYSTGEIIINTGSYISNNTALNYGGGIYAGTGSTVSMNGGEVSSNTSTNGEGGGFYFTASTVTISNGTISSNQARNGGGIAIKYGNSLKITGGTISNNTVGKESGLSQGAGIYLYQATADISGKTLITNNGKSSKTEYSACTVDGGGIFAAHASSFIISGSEVEISYNEANNGGGIYLYNQVNNIKDCVVKYNSADYRGGGIFISDKTSTIDNVFVEHNSAVDGGGGIHLNVVELIIENTKVTSNTSLSHGAGINSSTSNVTMKEGTEIKGNLINPETVADNKYPGRGAGVLVYNGTFTMNGGLISENEANDKAKRAVGAGVYISDGGKFILNDGVISKNKLPNKTYSYGANVYIKSETDVINSDGTFTVWNATFIMNGGEISGDGTTKYAYLGGGIFNLGVLDINGGVIKNLKANYGGAIANFGSSFNIGNVSITGCSSTTFNSTIISGDEITIDGSFDNVSGYIALGTSELKGVVSEDQYLAEGDYIKPMRTASLNIVHNNVDNATYNVKLFAYQQTFNEDIWNCEYSILTEEKHMRAFYLEGFSESGYTSHSDYYIFKFLSYQSSRCFNIVSQNTYKVSELYEIQGGNAYRLTENLVNLTVKATVIDDIVGEYMSDIVLKYPYDKLITIQIPSNYQININNDLYYSIENTIAWRIIKNGEIITCLEPNETYEFIITEDVRVEPINKERGQIKLSFEYINFDETCKQIYAVDGPVDVWTWFADRWDIYFTDDNGDYIIVSANEYAYPNHVDTVFFAYWEVDGEIYTDSTISTDTEFTAVYENYELTVNTSMEGTKTYTVAYGSDIYVSENSISFYAMEYLNGPIEYITIDGSHEFGDPYYLSHWEVDGNEVGETYIQITGDMSIIAVYDEYVYVNTYEVVINYVDPQNEGNSLTEIWYLDEGTTIYDWVVIDAWELGYSEENYIITNQYDSVGGYFSYWQYTITGENNYQQFSSLTITDNITVYAIYEMVSGYVTFESVGLSYDNFSNVYDVEFSYREISIEVVCSDYGTYEFYLSDGSSYSFGTVTGWIIVGFNINGNGFDLPSYGGESIKYTLDYLNNEDNIVISILYNWLG